jgi:phospholipid/cholesterol/gamma-HCH transport system substrate-binding protein
VKMTSQQIRFRYINRGVGALILLTVIFFVAAMLFSGRVQHWLDPGARLKVILPSEGLSGLSDGANVEVLGTQAGSVKQIVIATDQQIHAEVQIQSDLKDFIRNDSNVIIRKQFGVAGAAYLDISRGTGAPLDWEYAVLTAKTDRAPTESVGEMITDLRNKIFPVIDETHKAIQTLSILLADMQKPDGNMQQMLTNLTDITGTIVDGKGTVGRLLAEETMAGDIENLIAGLTRDMQRIGPLLNDLQATVNNASQITAKINKQSGDLPVITKRIKGLLVSVQSVMTDLSQTTPQLPGIAKNMNDATDSIPVLMLQTQQVMAELEQLLSQLQSSWLLGGKAGGKSKESARISPLEVRP